MVCCGDFCQVFRQEFRLLKFLFRHDEPHLFLTSQWQRKPDIVQLWYVIYRWFWAVYHLCWYLACVAFEGGLDASLLRKTYYYIYVTNWAYTSITLLNVLNAVWVTQGFVQQRRTGYMPKIMPGHLKFLWGLQNMVYLPAILITIAYWSAVYKPGHPITALNASVHICNSIYVLLDLMVMAHPLRILHFYVPFLFMFTYLLFTLVYWAAGGTTPDGSTAIYPIMDWDNLSLTIPFVVGSAVAIPFLQGVVWLWYRWRVCLRQRCHYYGVAVATMPHESTMEDMITRDGSLNSVAPTFNHQQLENQKYIQHQTTKQV